MDENRETVRRLTLAMSRMDGAYYYFARKSGLKENLLTLLYALDDGKPHSQKEVCEDWLIPKTTINTIVRELVTQGYATLLSSEGTREKTICLTGSGRAYAREALRVVHEAEQAALARALQRHPPAFIDALEDFSNCLCEEYEKRRAEQKGGKETP